MPDPSSREILRNLVWMKITKFGHFGIRHLMWNSRVLVFRHHLLISFFLLPHSYYLLCFNMSGLTIFQGAQNVAVSGGTFNAANTVCESLMVSFQSAFNADCHGSSADQLQHCQCDDVWCSNPSEAKLKHSIHRPRWHYCKTQGTFYQSQWWWTLDKKVFSPAWDGRYWKDSNLLTVHWRNVWTVRLNNCWP